MRFDAIVIGAGPNGLTTAAYLAREGKRVLVLEARDRIGGVAAREELHVEGNELVPYKTTGLLHDASRVRPEVIAELELDTVGMELMDPPPVFAPQKDGPGLLLYRNAGAAHDEIAAHSAFDAKRYPEFRATVDRFAPALARLLDGPAPQATSMQLGDLWNTLRTVLRLRKLGGVELLRILPMALTDWLGEWFESDLLKATLAAPALTGTRFGPRAAGTVALFLFEETLVTHEVAGGPAAVVDAVAGACYTRMVDIQTSSPVRRIMMTHGHATGVELADGTTHAASIIVSSCDPKTTFLELIAPPELPTPLDRAARAWHCSGTTAKVTLLLDGPLELDCRPASHFPAIRIASDTSELERAADAVKYRQMSEVPCLDIRVPTLEVPALSPEGHHIVSILVSFAPYDLDGGWSEARRRQLGDRVVDRLAAFAPSVKDRILDREVLTPLDIETRHGIAGGHIHHGEHALDQLLFQRPTPSCSRHDTPVPGLYLCGAGTHPGGGVTCGPGRLAARRILGR